MKLSDLLHSLFPIADERVIPALELDFYNDQKGPRQMVIGNIDVKTTKKNERKVQRQNDFKKQTENEHKRKGIVSNKDLSNISEVQNSPSPKKRKRVVIDTDFEIENDKEKKRKRLTKKEIGSLDRILEEAERFQISDEATASIVNAANFNAGVISENDNFDVLYQKKVNRLKKKARLRQVEERKGKSILAVGIDERKDWTKVQVGEGKFGAKRFQKEKVENCAIVYWPGEQFAGLVATSGGSGQELAKDVINFFEENDTDISELLAGLSDGCSKMTGWRNGTWACFERMIGHPVQRIVCFLHHTEKPFAALFKHYDGKTTGPNSFSGPIGSEITEDVWKLEVVEFERLENPTLSEAIGSLDSETVSNLSSIH